MALRTDYQDFVANAAGKKYIITDAGDGMFFITDATTYDQVGDSFSAGVINATNLQVNENEEAIKGITPASIGAVPESRKVNGKALTSDINLTASDVSAIPTSQKGAANGVATLDANGKVEARQAASLVQNRTASFTLFETLNGCFVYVNSSSAVTCALPDLSSLPDGFECEIMQYGAGTVTFALRSDVTGQYIRSLDNAKTTAGQYAVATIKKLSNTEWILAGALS